VSAVGPPDGLGDPNRAPEAGEAGEFEQVMATTATTTIKARDRTILKVLGVLP